jgi:hypothetical protein
LGFLAIVCKSSTTVLGIWNLFANSPTPGYLLRVSINVFFMCGTGVWTQGLTLESLHLPSENQYGCHFMRD